MREEIPAAWDQSDEIIVNGLGDFLRTLGEMVSFLRPSSDAEKSVERNLHHAQTHGSTRAQIPGYTLDQVITEYRILRSILFSVLEESVPLVRENRDRLLESIDNGMTAAATEFALLRGFSDARLSDAVTQKNIAVTKLKDATATIAEMSFEREARETFVSELSHDLRNPLGAAKLSAQLIGRDQSSSESTRKHALRIAESIDRTDRMIRDLLDSNRIQGGEPLPLRKEECDLVRILQATLLDLSHTFGARFTLDAAEPCRGYVDPDGLRRMIENLATNAVKYGAPDRPIGLAISQNEAEVKVSLHNEGNPISKSDQKTLFKRFRRTESAQTGDKKGWGIGLTLVRGIAEAHGGEVSVRSDRDAGTTFTITLPRAFPGLKTASPSFVGQSKKRHRNR